MIDLGEAQQALVESGANVIKAATALGVPPADLRKLMSRHPELTAVALEAAERDLDRAEQIIRDGMKSDDRMKRLEAAALILKGRFRGRR
jgi:predicted urease superfamily metal-dependent hydrolase